MCYKYVNAVNRYAAEGNKKTKTSPILKGVKAVLQEKFIYLGKQSRTLCQRQVNVTLT